MKKTILLAGLIGLLSCSQEDAGITTTENSVAIGDSVAVGMNFYLYPKNDPYSGAEINVYRGRLSINRDRDSSYVIVGLDTTAKRFAYSEVTPETDTLSIAFSKYHKRSLEADQVTEIELGYWPESIESEEGGFKLPYLNQNLPAKITHFEREKELSLLSGASKLSSESENIFLKPNFTWHEQVLPNWLGSASRFIKQTSDSLFVSSHKNKTLYYGVFLLNQKEDQWVLLDSIENVKYGEYSYSNNSILRLSVSDNDSATASINTNGTWSTETIPIKVDIATFSKRGNTFLFSNQNNEIFLSMESPFGLDIHYWGGDKWQATEGINDDASISVSSQTRSTWIDFDGNTHICYSIKSDQLTAQHKVNSGSGWVDASFPNLTDISECISRLLPIVYKSSDEALYAKWGPQTYEAINLVGSNQTKLFSSLSENKSSSPPKFTSISEGTNEKMIFYAGEYGDTSNIRGEIRLADGQLYPLPNFKMGESESDFAIVTSARLPDQSIALLMSYYSSAKTYMIVLK
jgi:hypothetical protein